METLKRLSRETQRFLGIEEGQNHDFKETLDALKVDDLVAFANSDDGGTVLLGVSTRGGVRRIVGCTWDDKAELSVRQRAAEADPPLGISLRAENTSRAAILIVVIPQSASRPHCTPGGRYLLRDGNKNRALKPTEMLTMFLDTHANSFIERFKAASRDLEGHLKALVSHVERVATTVNRMSHEVAVGMQESLEIIDNTHSNSDEAMTRADESAAGAEQANKKLQEIEYVLEDVMILLKQLANSGGHDMPDVFRAKKALDIHAAALAASRPDDSDKKLLAAINRAYKGKVLTDVLSPEQVRQVSLDAFSHIRRKGIRIEPSKPLPRRRRRR